MARKPMVTRSMKTTKATFLAMNIIEEKPEDVVVTLPRTYKDDNILVKLAQEQVDSNLKLVQVKSKEVIVNLYGMTEEEFIRYADILPGRNISAKEPENDAE